MSVQTGVLSDLTFSAGTSASLATSQYCIVALSGTMVNGQPGISLCTGTSFGAARAIGVLQDTPAAGRSATVRPLGGGNTSKVVATTSAGITLGASIACTTDGHAMVADTTGQRIIGYAVNVPSTAPTVGMYVEVLLEPDKFTL